MACSPRVAYDKCKRSRVDEAIREANVFLLTHVYHSSQTHVHAHIYARIYTSADLWQRARDVNEARPGTREEMM